MNNIYKVIWSKAKNCYVVASEIAKSHTKSASGSEKIGGGTRRKLLASLMALSLLCGGLGVASAVDVVNVDASSASGAAAVYTTEKVDSLLDAKADKTYVDTALNNKADKTYVDNAVANAVTTAGNDVNTKLADFAKTADVYDKATVDGKIAAEATARDTAINTAIGLEREDRDAAIGNAINGEATERNQAIHDAIELEKTNRDAAITNAKLELQGKITGEETERKEADTAFNNRLTTAEGKIGANETAIGELKAKDTALEGKINAEKTEREAKDNAILGRIGKVADDGNYIKNSNTNSVSKNLKALDAQAKINADAIVAETAARTNKDTELEGKINTLDGNVTTAQGDINDLKAKDIELEGRIHTNEGKIETNKNAIVAIDKRTAGIGRIDATNETTIEGSVKVDNQGNVKDVKGLSAETITTGALNVTGESSLKNTTVDGTLTAKGEATFKENVTMEKDLEVKGELKTDKISMKNDELDTNGNQHHSTTTITADGISNNAEVTDRNGVKTESKFTHDKEGSTTYAKKGDATDWKEATSNVTADGVENIAKDSKGNNNTFTQTSTDTKNTLTDTEGNTSSTRQDSKGVYGYAKDKDGNKSYTRQEGNRIAESVIGQDGKETKSEMTSTDITNTAKDGTITSDAKDIVNKATGNISNSSATMYTTVTGKATESYGELETEVKGNEKHTVKGDQTNEVDGKQINTIKNGQENIISGGQTNTITGGQINNITGDQTTTITGNKTETVTENVTEDYKKDLTTTVGGNETHEVKGTKTETVEGKVTENFKNGQETNVTGDQDIKVSGTQTTTATDINRNASSSMVDKVDNAYGTNTETKVAGKTTTDVSIKGTGEEGKYIRGANESRDYLIKGTLKNSETKTVEKTSTEITDGNGKTSATIQDVNNLAGSVTNGTETGVSGIHANDNSVSIDSIVTDGNKYSVINQKKGSIQSTVVDGTNSTVILQDKDNVTIASSNGTVAIGGKDIVNNASENITNTAKNITNAATETLTDKVGDNTRVTTSTSIIDTVGTTTNRKIEDGKIIDTANDSTVTTENGKGTTFAKTGSTAFSTEAGAPTDTNIAGNHITTGRVDANELKVSDKDDHGNTADLSVEAGEGVKASASDGATTGSLDVTAEEVGSSVTDGTGKGSTFKQRIDKIMMESKDVSIKAEETLTNEAKVITNKASEVINNEAININNTATGIITSKASKIKNQADKLISNKVGENTWENMEDGKITTSIKDGAKQNLTQSDAAGTTQSTVDGAKSTVTIQNADGLAGAVTDGRNTSVQNQTASAIATDVKDGAGNENASVANATTSANTITNGTKANTVISTADGTRFINSEANTAFEGGTYTDTTIKGNTITTGKVTMDYAEVMKDLGVHGSAKVDNNLEVGGTTTTKTLNVTEDAKVGRDLAVGGNAKITGDVTANSYKVGDKTYISADGINANNQKITNVADGSISEGSKDAVNGGQLYGVKRDLEHQVDKVGANAAAMANLHPMEFDPDSKWNIAAAMGNYGSETATAIGAFYRPNEDVMVNFSTAFGTGENMVGGGVSVRLGKGSNKLSREESNALKAQVNDLTARMDALLSVLNPNMSKDFPDVPENHWAYEAVSRLAGNDIVQGYPDGEFHGERTMTRYEMAEIIYNALSRGAEAEKELVEEFKPELQAMAASEKATAERAEG